MDFTNNLRLKKQMKDIPKEHLILQTTATVEDILQNYFNKEDIDFRGYEKELTQAYNYIYNFTTKMKDYCEKNVKKKYIAKLTETVILDSLAKGKIEDTVGFRIEHTREHNDMIIYYALLRLRDFIKTIKIDNEFINNHVKVFNMKIGVILGVFKKELGV